MRSATCAEFATSTSTPCALRASQRRRRSSTARAAHIIEQPFVHERDAWDQARKLQRSEARKFTTTSVTATMKLAARYQMPSSDTSTYIRPRLAARLAAIAVK